MWSCQCGSDECVHLLVASKADTNIRSTKAHGDLDVGTTARDIALFKHREEIANLLSAASAPAAPEPPFPSNANTIAPTIDSKRGESNGGEHCV